MQCSSAVAVVRRTFRIFAIAALVANATRADAQGGTSPSGAAPAPAEPMIDLGHPVTLVGPGVISRGWSESAETFTPDGNTLYFAVTDRAFTRMTIMEANRRNGEWMEAKVAPFSGLWNDGSSSLTPDGKRLFFISNRPLEGNAARSNLDLWYVDRAGSKWSEPHHVEGAAGPTESVSYPTATNDGTLYIMKALVLYEMKPTGKDTYSAPVRVPIGGEKFRVVANAVSPDGKFMIVSGPVGTSNTDSDLSVSFADGAGGWGPLYRLAPPVNSTSGETSPYISSDGKTLYFASDRGVTAADRASFWPRAHRVTTAKEVNAELLAQPMNGLRDIYQVSLEGLRPPAR